jgi:hypothetical protein
MTKTPVSVLFVFLMSSMLPAQTASPAHAQSAPPAASQAPSAAPAPAQKSDQKPTTPTPGAVAAAVTSPEVDPQASAILDRYVTAVGGKDAWTKYSSRVSKGTIQIPAMSMTGTVDVSEKAPNKMRSVVNIGDTIFQQGFDGTIGWADDPQNGPRLLHERELEELKRDAEFARPLHLRTLYSQIKFVGKEKLGDRDVQVIEVSSPQTGSEKMYFDSQSALLLRVVANRAGPDGNSTVESMLDDYADVDGMKLPMTVHQTAGSTSYVVHLTSVKHGVDVPDSTFTAPESAQ